MGQEEAGIGTAAASAQAIVLANVSRQFGNAAILHDVSFAIQPHEIVSLIGPSGCGKSSLLRIISGIDCQHSGSVQLFGRTVARVGAAVEPERRHVGFMLQDYALFPHLSVEENISFGIQKRPAAEVADRTSRIMSQFKIDHLQHKYPHMLSGGEQQRVALARALAPQPPILLMDEPFSNLDRRLAESIRQETLSILRELGTTTVLVTHDPEEALGASDRIIFMREGRVLQVGTPYELYYHPATCYTAEYFSAFNKLSGVYRGGMLVTDVGTFPSAFDVPEDSTVTVYLRPQSIAVSKDGDGLPAEIVERTFRGDGELLKVRLKLSSLELVVQIPFLLPPDTRRVGLVIPSVGALAFPD
ncbi:MAG: ABC transporter ATP-binding protein [Alphaproteobacteria bacterium]|nr:ABC transporter ATP-binding protein [Alphaproteobacteria bacterium]